MKHILVLLILLLMSSRCFADIICHYKMNDNLATAVVVDENGNHNGTYKDVGGNLNTDTGSMDGKINLALDFDGGDEYIEITDHADFSPILTPFSISAWVYMHNSADFMITSKTNEWLFFAASTHKLIFRLHDESLDKNIGRTYDTSLASYDDTWIHLIATYDGGKSASGIKLYLNGVRIDDTDDTSDATFDGVENLGENIYVGRFGGNNADGLIDNVMFFSQELDSGEIGYLYNGSAGREGWNKTVYRGRYSGFYRQPYRNRYLFEN